MTGVRHSVSTEILRSGAVCLRGCGVAGGSSDNVFSLASCDISEDGSEGGPRISAGVGEHESGGSGMPKRAGNSGSGLSRQLVLISDKPLIDDPDDAQETDWLLFLPML